MNDIHKWSHYIQSVAPDAVSDTKLLHNMLDKENKLTEKSLKFAMQNIKRRFGAPVSLTFPSVDTWTWTMKTERERYYEEQNQGPLYLIDSKGRTAYFDGSYGYLQWQPGFFLCLGWSDIWLVRRVHGKVQYWSDFEQYKKYWKEEPHRKNPYELLKDPGELTYVEDVLEYFKNTLGYSTEHYTAVHAPSDMVPRVRSFLGFRPVNPAKNRDRRKERIRRKKARKSR